MPITDSNLEGMFTFETDATPSAEELPFHILLLGDFAGDGEITKVENRKPIVVDRDNFNEVLSKLNVRLDLDFQEDGQTILSIRFEDIDDFHPDQLFRNVSAFSELRQIRKDLKNTETFAEAADKVKSWFQSGEPELSSPNYPEKQIEANTVSSDNLLDEILSRPATSPKRADSQPHDSDLDRLISQLVAPFLVRIDESEQTKLVATVDSAISGLMQRILHHPKFQALESAWRGLYFLTRRIETDIDLKIFIVPLSKSECVDNLKQVNNLTDSQLYRLLIRETLETPGAEPWSIIGGIYSFTMNIDDVAALMRIGKLSAVADAPFVSHISPELFGLDTFAQGLDSDNCRIDPSSEKGKLWSALRSLPEASYLGFSPMRFLARMPYGAATDSTETFDFEEFTDAPQHSEFLWTNPCFAIVLLFAQGFRAFGWEMASRLPQDIERLPIYFYEVDGETGAKPCAEVSLTESVSEKLTNNGLMSLISFRNTDRIRLARFQSASSLLKTLSGRWDK